MDKREIAMNIFDDLPREAREIINYSKAHTSNDDIISLMKYIIEDKPDDLVSYVQEYIKFNEQISKRMLDNSNRGTL